MEGLVAYEIEDGIATVRLDDGKVNAQSPAMLEAIGEALDRAEADASAVIITGREEVFSAGFDLKVFTERQEEIPRMLQLGARLNQRLLGFPKPVVAAVNGNAIAAGAFLTLSADVRIGAEGPYKIGMNEVRIGLVVPTCFMQLAEHRMSPAHYDRAVVTAEMFDPADAVDAGFLDTVVPHGEVWSAAMDVARDLATLNMDALAATKQRVRGPVIEAMDASIEAELVPRR